MHVIVNMYYRRGAHTQTGHVSFQILPINDAGSRKTFDSVDEHRNENKNQQLKYDTQLFRCAIFVQFSGSRKRAFTAIP
jgi:hypothetical protein